MPDTNVLIAAVQDWHLHHEPARSELGKRRANGDRLILVAQSLIECYSVLTRLPPTQRVRPHIALDLIRTNYVERGEVVGLDAPAYWPAVERAAAAGVSGGRVYDALIAETARAAGAEVLLTFNVRHFAGIAGGMAIVEPGAT